MTKLEEIRALIEKTTKGKERPDYSKYEEGFDFNGNFDDTYYAGKEDGELELAFDILDILNKEA